MSIHEKALICQGCRDAEEEFERRVTEHLPAIVGRAAHHAQQHGWNRGWFDAFRAMFPRGPIGKHSLYEVVWEEQETAWLIEDAECFACHVWGHILCRPFKSRPFDVVVPLRIAPSKVGALILAIQAHQQRPEMTSVALARLKSMQAATTDLGWRETSRGWEPDPRSEGRGGIAYEASWREKLLRRRAVLPTPTGLRVPSGVDEMFATTHEAFEVQEGDIWATAGGEEWTSSIGVLGDITLTRSEPPAVPGCGPMLRCWPLSVGTHPSSKGLYLLRRAAPK